MELHIEAAAPEPPSAVEVVERKGLGHPDTLCDAIAERVSVRLCRHYEERFGAVLHHNVDKVLLVGGASRPAFGGGVVTEPIEIYLAGRATTAWRGAVVPAAEIAADACREVLREAVPELDVERQVRIFPRLRPGSADLTAVFSRGTKPLSNDTSCAVGFAPFTDLERAVLAVERRLTGPETRSEHPSIGSDVKVMGVRRGERVALSVACAFVGRHLCGLEDYVREREVVRALAADAAHAVFGRDAVDEVTVNGGDDLERGEVYLTVTGTSAEAGDDGEVGRGNRPSGLITPQRWMTLEAACGKNPVSHAGKIYGVLAERLAARLVRELLAAQAALLLVSRIGRPVDDPQLVHVKLGAERLPSHAAVLAIAEDELRSLPSLTRDLAAGRHRVF